MLRKRDAQGLPIRYIILAILALIVLIVAMAIFGSHIGELFGKLESCESKGGKCVPEKTDEGGRFCPWEKEISMAECGDKEVCCAKI